MISVTPIFDQLNLEWKAATGWPLPFGLKIVSMDGMMDPDEAIDLRLGILPLYGAFQTSFPNEQLDFTAGSSHVIITEGQFRTGTPDENSDAPADEPEPVTDETPDDSQGDEPVTIKNDDSENL